MGKGDSPRNCHTPKFRANYDEIDWGHKKKDHAVIILTDPNKSKGHIMHPEIENLVEGETDAKQSTT